jgi:hypothetical protein
METVVHSALQQQRPPGLQHLYNQDKQQPQDALSSVTVVKQHWGQLKDVVVCMVNHHPVVMPCRNIQKSIRQIKII